MMMIATLLAMVSLASGVLAPRGRAGRYGVACVCAVGAVVALRMVYLEAGATDGDLDIIFFFAMLFWSGVTATLALLLFLLGQGLRRIWPSTAG